jgi:hypothetical protein
MSTTIRELLSDESKWTRYTLSRDAAGTTVDPLDDDAVSFCVMGACCRVYFFKGKDAAQSKLDEAANKLFPERLAERSRGGPVLRNASFINDHPATTFEDIRKLLEEADV